MPFPIAFLFRLLPSVFRRVKLYRLLKPILGRRSQLVKLKGGEMFFAGLSDQGVSCAIISQNFDNELVKLIDFFSVRNGVIFGVGANELLKREAFDAIILEVDSGHLNRSGSSLKGLFEY